MTQVVSTLRAALDSAHADAARFSPRPEWNAMLARHAEGSQVTKAHSSVHGNERNPGI